MFLGIKIPFFNNGEKEENKELNNVISEADALYEEQNYDKAMEVLRAYESNDCDLQWRIMRLLCQKLYKNNPDVKVHRKLASDVYKEACRMQEENKSCSTMLRWKVISLVHKLNTEGYLAKIQGLSSLRSHLEKAVDAEPGDVTSLHLLGMWHFNMSRLPWLQRQLIQLLSPQPITASYEQSLEYFERIEKQEPRRYLCNVYMLGTLNYELKRYFKARYYAKIATGMDAKNDFELDYLLRARVLSHHLKHYDVYSNAENNFTD